MKAALLLLLATLTVNLSWSQNASGSNVPQPVKTAFAQKFPKASGVEWEKEGQYYVAEFKTGALETEVVFDGSGKILETEEEIVVTGLPKAAQDFLAQKQSGQLPREITKETNSKGQVSYEVEFKGAEYEFDANGNLLEAEEEGSDDEEDEEDEDNNGDRP